MRQLTEHRDDQAPLPAGFEHLALKPSTIEGMGLFTSKAMAPGAIVGPARIDGKRTPLGRFANHSPWPNAMFRLLPNGGLESVAVRPIPAGGEILNDYRQGAHLFGVRFNLDEMGRTFRQRVPEARGWSDAELHRWMTELVRARGYLPSMRA